MVIPAIRKKMSWAKKVTLQFDNAPGHKTQGTKADKPHSAIATKLADVLKPHGNEIVIFGQEANSPDTNTNDVGFQNCFDSRVPSSSSPSISGLVRSVRFRISFFGRFWRL